MSPLPPATGLFMGGPLTCEQVKVGYEQNWDEELMADARATTLYQQGYLAGRRWWRRGGYLPACARPGLDKPWERGYFDGFRDP